ncbi:MAG TPA: prolyl oligopeptidase family serine peptidase [Gemmatimonadales bacterium]|nr:prolyl oligopeptidase family serine peptidase [Gemmatimonadales bacterium]
MPRSAALLLALLVVPQLPAQEAGTVLASADDLLAVTSWNVQDLSRDGAWLAVAEQPRRALLGGNFHRDTDPTYIRPVPVRLWVIETATGERRAVFPDPRTLRGAAWSPDGSRLAVLAWQGEALVPMVWERRNGRTSTVRIPAGRYVAENSELRWSEDGARLLFSLRTERWRSDARAVFDSLTRGPVAIQSSEAPFLAWEALRRHALRRSVVAWESRTGRLQELLPDTTVSSWNLAGDGVTLTWNEDITPKTDYDVIFGTEQRLVMRRDTMNTVLLPTTKGLTLSWAPDGLHYAWGREGRIYLASVDDTTSRQVAGPAANGPPVAGDTAAARQRALERFSVVRWRQDGTELIVSNSEGLWFLNVASGAKEMFQAIDTAASAPRQAVVAWPAGGQAVYLSYASRSGWERGLMRYDRATRRVEPVALDDRLYSGLRFSEDGATATLLIADGGRPADLWVGSESMRRLQRLVETNPQLAGRELGATRLLDYLDIDGRKQFGVVHLPVGYREGQRYPTVFIVYETFFDNNFDATAALLNAHGYLVVKPSVTFETGYPWEAWLKGVNAAATRVVEMGLADSTRMGVHGTSYGGYATNLLIARTNRFKAAINISGKVDIISFYTDSPRLGVRNIHAAEKSQDRLGATLWEAPLKYIEHSAVMYADRIKTPLLLMTGDQDHNVPAGNTREMYYALRRLGRTVTWVNYMNGGHGVPMTTEADFRDYHDRILAWYGKYLAKPEPIPVTENDRVR